MKLDLEKLKLQYKNILVKKVDTIHDRFLFIDDELYHIGSSLKDLGKKLFAFSRLEKESYDKIKELIE